MGLGFRIGSSRPVILSSDSSIMAGSDYQAYAESLFDESHLKLDPSDPPARFVVRGLTDEQRDAVDAQLGARARLKLCVRCGLLSHSGYTVQRVSGEVTAVPLPDMEPAGQLGTVVSERWIRTLGIDGYDGGLRTDVLVGLFGAITALSEATLPLSKRSAPGSGPPAASSKASAPSPSPAPGTAPQERGAATPTDGGSGAV